MFHYISGKLAALLNGAAVVDAGGVGFKLTVSNHTLEKIAPAAPQNGTVKLYTHMAVREDGMELFGFADEAELETFRLLITVSGVGPKAAMSILSSFTPEKFALAVCTEDRKIIARANEKGFLVTYNHAIWSMQDTRDYIGLKGLWGVEVFNGECYMLGYDSETNHVYQELLKEGNRVFPLAVDDTHSPRAIGMGFIMVGAKELTYPAVIEALEKGDLYASTGPEIHSLTLDGRTLKVSCTEAVTVQLQVECRRCQRVVAAPGETLTEVEFDLSRWLDDCQPGREKDAFIRVNVTDAAGHRAFTRAYWRTELFEE